MKVEELDDKIIIAELDPGCDYICLVNPALMVGASFAEQMDRVEFNRSVPIVHVRDVHKAVSFVEVKDGQGDTEKSN